jgi:hypothetical protein
MFKKTLIFCSLALVVLLLSSCGQSQTGHDENQAIIDTINANISLFDVGESGSESLVTSSSAFTTSQMPAFIWYRIFNWPSPANISVLSNDGTTAIVNVSRTVDGNLYMHMEPFASREAKGFLHNYNCYVELTSENGGISWQISRISSALSESAEYSPASGVGSVDSNITIERMVITATSTTGTTTLFDVTQEPSASGPWYDFDLPTVNQGDVLEVTVYASVAGDPSTPHVYVWPIYKNCFRRPLFDDGTHGDTVAGDGEFVNTQQPFNVPEDAVKGIRLLQIGVFSSGTLSDTTTPYDFSCWHFAYRIE